MSEDQRRRLKLMPEVLPAPPGRGEGGPRQRTLSRLGRLMTLAAAAAALGGCKESSTGGYGVVDPMPPPPRCTGLAASIQATAVWKAPNRVVVTLSAPTMSGGSYVTGANPMVSDGTLINANLKLDSAEIEIEVGKAPPKWRATLSVVLARVTVFAVCPSGNQQVNATITLPNGGADGGPLEVTLSDGY